MGKLGPKTSDIDVRWRERRKKLEKSKKGLLLRRSVRSNGGEEALEMEQGMLQEAAVAAEAAASRAASMRAFMDAPSSPVGFVLVTTQFMQDLLDLEEASNKVLTSLLLDEV